jgi:hypothetical protein
MTNKELVQAIYRGAFCEEFYFGSGFPEQKFIVRYWPNKFRAEPIGWGSTVKNAWKDAAGAINNSMLMKLES